MCRLTLASGTFETHKKPPAGKVPLKHGKSGALAGSMRRHHAPLKRSFLLPRHHGVVEPVVGQALVTLNARIPERGVLIATKGEDRLIHLLGIEYS